MYTLTEEVRKSLSPARREPSEKLSDEMVRELAAAEPLVPELTFGMTVGEASQIIDGQFQKEIGRRRFMPKALNDDVCRITG